MEVRMSFHGSPCWFELSVADPAAAQAFYAPLLGWEWADAGMPGFDYRLARSGPDRVAGLMALSECPAGTPPNWMIYLAVDACDATAALAEDLGGTLWKPPADIPGTGRFAVLADPQGAVFGILQPLAMDPPPDGGAFSQRTPGHAAWIELSSSNPRAALEFYRKLFDWRQDMHFDLGPMGGYHILAHRGRQIGGIRALGTAPCPNWQPYFGVASLAKAAQAATAAGGKVVRGPDELPGPTHVAALCDPQGAHFNLIAQNR
jgi:predicted enzyme related to lactoylglutathione lyase